MNDFLFHVRCDTNPLAQELEVVAKGDRNLSNSSQFTYIKHDPLKLSIDTQDISFRWDNLFCPHTLSILTVFHPKVNNVQKSNDFSPKTPGILAKTQFFGNSEILICW